MHTTLTADEITILQDRLGVPDAIADALEQEYNRDKVEFAAEQLSKTLVPGDQEFRKLEFDILQDCCDGSTFFANSYEWNQSDLTKWSKVADGLQRKFGVEIPRR
jgi:hypothetical protein